MDSETTRQFMIDNNLREPLTIAGDWKWGRNSPTNWGVDAAADLFCKLNTTSRLRIWLSWKFSRVCEVDVLGGLGGKVRDP